MIDAPHLAGMTGQFAILDHQRHSFFQRAVALSIDRLADHRHAGHQIRSGNDIAKPDSWREQLGQRPDIKDGFSGGPYRNRQHRRTLYPIIMIIIIFEDDESCCAGKFDQAEMPRRWWR